jgi:hypothetical protein
VVTRRNHDSDCTSGAPARRLARDRKSFQECGNESSTSARSVTTGIRPTVRTDGTHCDHDSDCISGQWAVLADSVEQKGQPISTGETATTATRQR